VAEPVHKFRFRKKYTWHFLDSFWWRRACVYKKHAQTHIFTL